MALSTYSHISLTNLTLAEARDELTNKVECLYLEFKNIQTYEGGTNFKEIYA